MKKFEFKLEGLLKLREFKEDRIKIELGEIVKQITQTKDAITTLNKNIDEAYASQEKELTLDGGQKHVRFYAYYIEGQRNSIKNKESLLYSLQKKYDSKVRELEKAMGEVKVIEQFKEKSFEQFKKEMGKKEQETIEELVTMRRRVVEMP